MTADREFVDITVGGNKKAKALIDRLNDAMNIENIPMLEQALKENPGDIESSFKLAFKYHYLGNLESLEKASRLLDGILNQPDQSKKIKAAARTDSKSKPILDQAIELKKLNSKMIEIYENRK